ncbi:NFU1 iron-sulfur cluster scaffold homolog, mitochondrial [Aduncisulcus paluster]|uniref:NFU1 iron-sulfur cluster scaffold homolog, mitochondrial n=1 Tax=Aduncisulcus paluster TaxID=2918883 RepID=A0ABQ5KTX0_9EUKA|nr:NFU1 iron-sulfur cluster scaffold homolog, mitochondrial [Aduncisulcus paluster]|eukprot:gnl/Carplike_NY0171/2470_a3321_722.p1 GENE.gnl/Carplike_NY0171/2470_a3321_722~~gnl/Carplike_NY0171/2470_a3321_722.p1  ORF type:complete len:234 (-),score=44.38 gnl/Carplike_NY0171/2470_a3321_722:153-854(-)
MLSSVTFSLSSVLARCITVKATETPVPRFYRYVLSVPVYSPPEGQTPFKEFSRKNADSLSPLAADIFKSDDRIQSVLMGSNNVVVRLDKEESWKDGIEPKVMKVIKDFYKDDESRQAVTIPHAPTVLDVEEALEKICQGRAPNSNDDLLTSCVLEILELVIRPVLAADGGNCDLASVNVLSRNDDGSAKEVSVYVYLLGACKGCSQSTATLQGFVLQVLKKFIPEITAVEQME